MFHRRYCRYKGKQAAIPLTTSFQASITEGGSPIGNGLYDITFRLYDAATVGNVLWEENHAALPVSGGIVDVTLGSLNPPDSLAFDQTCWVEIEFEAEVLGPRTALASSPCALRTVVADSAAAGGTSEVLPITRTLPGIVRKRSAFALRISCWGGPGYDLVCRTTRT